MKKTLIIAICLFSAIVLHAKTKPWIQRLEPTFWWTDMKNTELQLMLYGQGISAANVVINYPGVTITEKKVTDNPNYVFLYLNIAKESKAGKFNIELRKGKKKQVFSYELKARRAGSAMRESFSEADAVYLIMPDRFANGNTANDSVKGYHQGVNRSDLGKRHGGDIEGMISKIPYLADLGITALWTTPLFDNNDTNYSYHHYACSDYYKVDPRLGTNEDFVRLTETCANHNIKYILDVVPNHCGSSHWWLKDLPATDWFNVWPSFTSSNYRMTAWTDPYRSEADLHRLTNGWFAPNMPDFNLKNPLLFDYLRQVYVFWIEYANVAGLRVDTYPYNDIRLAASFIQSIRDEYPNMNVVGECWVKTPAETAYYQSGNNNKDGFDSRLPSVMDFLLKDVLHEAINQNEGWESGMARYYAHYAQDFVYANPNLLMNFLDNHDIDRFTTAVKGDVRKYKMGLAMLLTTRGYPQIYYGNEIMLDGIAGSYEGHRFDFPGGWATDKRNAFTPEGRTASENEIFEYTKTLLNYRKNNSVLHNGKMKQFIPQDGIYVYFRYNNDKTIMVVANNNIEDKQLDLNRFAEMVEKKTSGTDIATQKKYSLNQPLTINGKTVLILDIL
jgi:glycosidase